MATATATGEKIFAAGHWFGINNVTSPTPSRAIVIQDQSITFKRATKQLYGANQLPVSVASTTLDITGKVTMGALNARIYADLLFGITGSSGETLLAIGEAGAIPGSSTFTVTVTNSATWSVDLGVFDKTTGTRMIRVASGPIVGQYSVAAGVYTFAAANKSDSVSISYEYTTTGTGETLSLTNQPMGFIGDFTAVMGFLGEPGDQSVLTLNSCLISNAEVATKLDDFGKPSIEFSAATDSNDLLGSWSFTQAA